MILLPVSFFSLQSSKNLKIPSLIINSSYIFKWTVLFLGHRISTESKNPGNGVPLPDSNDERKIDRTTRKGWLFNILELRTQCIEIVIFTKQKIFLCHKVKKGT